MYANGAGMSELMDGTLSLPDLHDPAPRGEQPAMKALSTHYPSIRNVTACFPHRAHAATIFLTSHPLQASSSYESVPQLQHPRAACAQTFVFSLVRRRHGPLNRSAIVTERGLHAPGTCGSFATKKIW